MTFSNASLAGEYRFSLIGRPLISENDTFRLFIGEGSFVANGLGTIKKVSGASNWTPDGVLFERKASYSIDANGTGTIGIPTKGVSGLKLRLRIISFKVTDGLPHARRINLQLSGSESCAGDARSEGLEASDLLPDTPDDDPPIVAMEENGASLQEKRLSQ